MIILKEVGNYIKNSSKSIFGQKNYHKRIVFSLVGKTNNSENTIRMHREREKKIIYMNFMI